MGLLAARRGFRVICVNLESVKWHYEHPNLKFIRGDIFKLDLHENHFDLIINCSTVVHVGLAGRYSVVYHREDGVLKPCAYFGSSSSQEG